MPRDSAGVYSLPVGYKATLGTLILDSQHNPPLEDIQTALTESLPRNGRPHDGEPADQRAPRPVPQFLGEPAKLHEHAAEPCDPGKIYRHGADKTNMDYNIRSLKM